MALGGVVSKAGVDSGWALRMKMQKIIFLGNEVGKQVYRERRGRYGGQGKAR